jgi:hypothetical protein
MRLKPVLGPVQLIFYSVGVIIGAGVYSVLGAAAAEITTCSYRFLNPLK